VECIVELAYGAGDVRSQAEAAEAQRTEQVRVGLELLMKDVVSGAAVDFAYDETGIMLTDEEVLRRTSQRVATLDVRGASA
jgi:hypothetical protein